MKRISFLVVVSLIFLLPETVISQHSYWHFLSSNEADHLLRGQWPMNARDFRLVELDYDKLVNQLAEIENERDQAKVLLPLADGSLVELTANESKVLPTSVARKYPSIRSFRGVSTTGQSIRARFDHGHLGFHALIFTQTGMVFIEPVSAGNKHLYQIYNSEDAIIDSETMRCGVDDSIIDREVFEGLQLDDTKSISGKDVRNRAGDPVTLRVYKLALAAAGEYTQARGGTIQAALSHMVMTINTVNEVFINDNAIKFELIDRIEDIIYIDPTSDPYPSVQADELLNINTTVLNNVLGVNKYDLGHVLSQNCASDNLDFGVAGISGFQISCSVNKRGAGVSCHFGSDLGFIFTTAHEFGHHFGASHTWSNCPGAMGQLSPGTAYEPGSGSTIMSYGHACGSQNVGPRGYYFHVTSLEQIHTYIKLGTGSQCPEEIPTGNMDPVASILSPNASKIPISTPFALIGDASDDNDSLTYNWEQYNLGPTSTVGNPIGTSPSFVSVPPSLSPVRNFPNLNTILSSTSNDEEVLPTYSRNLTFRLTVRDNHPEGGGVDWKEISFDATEDAGPFFVTYPNFPEDWELNSVQNITWNVANTDDPNGVNCQEVDILLSVDGGQSFPYILADNTPNDGAQEVVIPEVTTSQARIKVQASDNVFFDISNYNFKLIEPTQPGFSINITPVSSQVCIPDVLELVITSNSFLGFNNLISLDITSILPPGTLASFGEDQIIPSSTTTLTLDMLNVDVEGNYDITIRAIASGADTITRTISLELVQNDFSEFELKAPSNGLSGVTPLPTFTWQTVQDADSYEFELATNPSFIDGLVEFADNITDGSFQPSVTLDENQLYYWRVRPVNNCGPHTWSKTFAFHTVTLDCQQDENNQVFNISSSGSPTINSSIFIQGTGEVADVNIPNMNGIHDFVGQLTAKLVSPSGTEIILFKNECFNLSNFNLGFDDEATKDVQCPLVTGDIHRPQQALSTFIGEPIQGDWILRLEDNGPGGGGAFEGWDIQICSNSSASNPYIVTNDTLKLAPDESLIIDQSNLLTEDDENTPDELTYTIVKAPDNGILRISNSELETGDQFTQADLDNALIDYKNLSGQEQTDSFLFTVIDGEGGWLQITQFNILIDSSLSVGVDQRDLSHTLRVYPNPATNYVIIESNQLLKDVTIELFNLKGQLLETTQLDQLNYRTELPLRQITEGIYLLRLVNQESFAMKKIIVQRQ